MPVRLHLDDDVSRIEILTADALRGELERAAIWLDKKGDTAAPPLNVVRDILTLQTRPLPRLRAVVDAPFFNGEGVLVVTPGYHPDAEVYLRLPERLRVHEVPAAPAPESSTAQTDWQAALRDPGGHGLPPTNLCRPILLTSLV